MNQVEGIGILAANIDLLGQLKGTETLLSNSTHSICLHSYIAFGYGYNIVPAVEWTLKKMKELRDLSDAGDNFPLRKLSGTVKECAQFVLSGVERLAIANADKDKTLSEGLQKALEGYRQVPMTTQVNLFTQVKLRKTTPTQITTTEPQNDKPFQSNAFVTELQKRVGERFTAKQKEAEIQKPKLPVRFEFELRKQKSKLNKTEQAPRDVPKEEIFIVLSGAFDKVRERLQSSLLSESDLMMSFVDEEKTNYAQSN